MLGEISVKVFVVLLSRDRDRHLVLRGRDSSKTPENFHRLLGGHLEFGETLAAGVVREIREELDVELAEPHVLGTVENVFTFEGRPGHEIVFVFGGRVEGDPVPPGGAWRDDGGPIWVEWRPVGSTQAEIPLYPAGAQPLSRRQWPDTSDATGDTDLAKSASTSHPEALSDAAG